MFICKYNKNIKVTLEGDSNHRPLDHAKAKVRVNYHLHLYQLSYEGQVKHTGCRTVPYLPTQIPGTATPKAV